MSITTVMPLIDKIGRQSTNIQVYDATTDSFLPLTSDIFLGRFSITQSSVAVTTTSQTLIAANTARKYLAWMIVGSVDVTISPASPVVSGVGFVYQNGGLGNQGSSQEFIKSVPTNAFYVIGASAGSTVYIWEGA